MQNFFSESWGLLPRDFLPRLTIVVGAEFRNPAKKPPICEILETGANLVRIGKLLYEARKRRKKCRRVDICLAKLCRSHGV
jgi:hypothetical protein